MSQGYLTAVLWTLAGKTLRPPPAHAQLVKKEDAQSEVERGRHSAEQPAAKCRQACTGFRTPPVLLASHGARRGVSRESPF